MRHSTHKLTIDNLNKLIGVLRDRGYEVIGPLIRDHAIAFGPVSSVDDFPAGWTADTEAGHYRLQPRADGAIFGYWVSPVSLKQYVHPPQQRLVKIEKQNGSLHIVPETPAAVKRAFIGVRSCDLAALHVLDRVLLHDRFVDDTYAANRRDMIVVAVNCTESAPTCFCASLGTGPKAQSGFDIALTERCGDAESEFLAEAGTETGAELLREAGAGAAPQEWLRQAQRACGQAASAQKRRVDAGIARQVADAQFENRRWDETGKRCLACANCTMSCPTCFCVNAEDRSDLSGAGAERWRTWDSCFTQSFSYIHGGSVRLSVKSRYRQWLSHKLARWQDQFETPGCVGCGRCITWCPVGIDLTAEYNALSEGVVAHGK